MKRKNTKTARIPLGPRVPGPLRDDRVTIEWLRQSMRQFVGQRAWEKYHVPRNLAASICVEAGELLELFQWLAPDEAAQRCAEDEAFRRAVGEELSDVLMYCVSLANAMDLPIAQSVAMKMERNCQKYPPEKFKGHYERPLDQR